MLKQLFLFCLAGVLFQLSVVSTENAASDICTDRSKNFCYADSEQNATTHLQYIISKVLKRFE